MNASENHPPHPEHPPVYGGHPYGDAAYGSPYGEESALAGLLDPMRILQIVRKRWLMILLATVFAVSAALYYLKKTPRIYRAGARIEVSVRRPRILNKQDAVIEDPLSMMQAGDTLNTQIQKLNSSRIVPYVLENYRKLYPDDRTPDQELMARLSARANFSLQRDTRLVSVTAIGRDPEFIVRLCNSYAAAAESSVRAENRSVSDAAVVWLEHQAELQREALAKAEKDLLVIRQQYRMDVLESQRMTIKSSQARFNELLIQVEGKIALEQQVLSALENLELKPEAAGELPADVPRAAEVESALKLWRQALAERDGLLSRYTLQHPVVVAQDQVVALYREQAQSALERVKATTAANLALFREQVRSLRLKSEEQLQRAIELEREILAGETKIEAHTRLRRAAEASYQGVLFRIQDARLSADENTASIKLVESATSAVQIRPQPRRTLFTALMFGLIAGLGLAMLTELLEDHIFTAHEIEALAGIKILAVIPHVKVKDRRDLALASLTRSHGEVAESFAGLRTLLDSQTYREHARVILVSSSLPEEGKTSTSCNLAATFARNGQKTLLIDFDLRRPRLGRIFPPPAGRTGLLDYLKQSELPYPGSLVYTAADCPNLDVITTLKHASESPSDLVGSGAVVDLITWARNRYDHVIIDTPPLGMVSDALVLAAHSDIVLIMARPAATRRRVLRHTVQRFRDAGVTILAGVLNDIDLTAFSSYGYGPYHHYRKAYKTYTTDTVAARDPESAGG